jgi:iron(III) transport system ATP-binding protein
VSDLEINDLRKSYETQGVLADLDLEVEAGSFVSILGPSGSGKTTLLRLIAGFERADAGRIVLQGRTVDDESHFVEAPERRLGYVPQEGNLFPHLSVEANVGFGLARKDRHGRRVTELLEMVGLGGLARRFPHELSGGQQQRVALARGLAIDPALVLLDEPFSSLDASLRASVRHDVRHVLRESGTTAILVTHDQDEALSLADRVAILRDGRICQFDTPAKLYARPATPQLAREFGNANLLFGTLDNRSVVTPLGPLELDHSSLAVDLHDGARLLVLVRPEQIVLVDRTRAEATARVLESEFYGHDAVVKLRPSFDESIILTARTPNPTLLPERGAEVGLRVTGPVVGWPNESPTG